MFFVVGGGDDVGVSLLPIYVQKFQMCHVICT